MSLSHFLKFAESDVARMSSWITLSYTDLVFIRMKRDITIYDIEFSWFVNFFICRR